MNGFGAVSRDSGQSRVPAPPERMMGTTLIAVPDALLSLPDRPPF
jgi:hypothetical protein